MAAIDAHKASQHFADWKLDTDGLLAWKKAGKYEVIGRDERLEKPIEELRKTN